MPADIRYPWIMVTGGVSYPWRVSGTGTSTRFRLRIRADEYAIRAVDIPLEVKFFTNKSLYFKQINLHSRLREVWLLYK
jgi:hypothetical protein